MAKLLYVFIVGLIISITSCGSDVAQPIKLNTDVCAFCKMTISSDKFGAEIITNKGRVYMFDDLVCLVKYNAEKGSNIIRKAYIHNYLGQNDLIPAETAYYVYLEELRSPMGGNIAAFRTESEANEFNTTRGGKFLKWDSLLQTN